MYRFWLIILFLSVSAWVLPDSPEKINGVNLVAPPDSITSSTYASLKNINTGWIALNPYAYCEQGAPEVRFDEKKQWWGECSNGVKTMTGYAKQYKLKVMIKPHLWLSHHSWAGDFDLERGQDWRKWEREYERYILNYVQIAEEMEVEAFCMGTEITHAVEKRPIFWRHLIREIRAVYHGKITYAANWDSYERVPFWKDLDYIGVDAYFPLSEEDVPKEDELIKAWQPYLKQLKAFSDSVSKPVLFTEYGYRSIDQCAWKQWELPEYWEKGGTMNMQGQLNAYSALYAALWQQEWFAGGFLWKWYPDRKPGVLEDTDYTPQGKAVEQVIKRWYSGNNQ